MNKIIEAAKCVICDGEIHLLKKALVAPFLAKRIWHKAPFVVDLVQCESCGFIFYNPRLDDNDLRLLYRNYRSEEYQEMRYSSEPWYTPKFNTDLASASSYASRRALLGPILRRHTAGKKISRILDYGGDRGDLVAGLFEGAEAYVYDISGIPAAEGVIAIDNPVRCKADLIINSNVLEHVGFPRELVSEMIQAASDEALIFVEVPCEVPLGIRRIARRFVQTAVTAVLRPHMAWSVLRPASLYMMHEHINYFNARSLAALMQACGVNVIASGAYLSNSRAGRADVAWCIATKSPISEINIKDN